jgi:hypothetical protein
VSLQTNLPLEIHTRLLPSEPDLYNGHGRWPQQLSDFAYSGNLHTSQSQPAGGTDLVSKAHTTLGVLLDNFPREMAQLGFVGGQLEKNWDSLIAKAARRRQIYLHGYFIQKFAPTKLRPTLLRQILGHDHGMTTQNYSIPSAGLHEDYMAVHVRLGDNTKNLIDNYSDFFEHAVKRAETELGRQRLKLFSDQPEIARNLLSSSIGTRELQVSTAPNAILALREMSNCNGLIATPSTFAWWGGFLQQHQSHVYMGSPWVKASEFDQSTIYPDAWNIVSKIG